jgi:adenine-specific DNA glycosylase
LAASHGGNTASDSLVVVAAALVDRDGRLLVQQRPEGTSMAGLWEFPGGKREIDPAIGRAQDGIVERGADPAAKAHIHDIAC